MTAITINPTPPTIEPPVVIDEITIGWAGTIVPKARPRVRRSGHTYMPPHYQAWMRQQVTAFEDWWDGQSTITNPVLAYLDLYGKHDRSGDADNTIGAVLDALVKARVIRGDNMLRNPGQGAHLYYSAKLPPTAILRLQILEA